jgi:hypothetical protein
MAVNLVQALVAVGRIDDAQSKLESVASAIPGASRRLHLLLSIEAMRIALARKDLVRAGEALARAKSLAAGDQQAFEHTETGEAEAELARAHGDMARAEDLLRQVIVRCAAGGDDLAPREVVARLRHAEALDVLGRAEEADRVLAAALRRALARGLFGHADALRTRIAARGGSERTWFPGEQPVATGGETRTRFVRQRPLGSGGYGTVGRAYDLELGIEVAIKSFRIDGLYDVGALERLVASAQNEIAALSRIEHPGVARVYGLLARREGSAQTIAELQIVEELIEGATLRAAMAAPMERSRALDVLARIAFSLAAVHAAGIVHRDLKPENVMLRKSGAPVLVDFGIAIVGRAPKAVRAAGTRTYMAPEQARGRRVDARADLYALGVMAHELLVSAPPEAPSASLVAALSRRAERQTRSRLVAAGIERAVADLVARLLAPHPRRRPKSAASVAQVLAQAAERRRAGS